MSSSSQKNALWATLAIFLSRILGLVREQVFSFFFGASLFFDAFIVAFRIPNILRDLLAEGALSQSFVAVFSKLLGRQKKPEATELARRMFGFIYLCLGLLVVLGLIFAPYAVKLLASSFTGEKFDLTVRLTRIMMPFILFVSLAALAMGVLNALGHFFVPHSASSAFNIVSLVSGLAGVWLFAPDYALSVFKGELPAPGSASLAIIAMAVGVLMGGLAQFLIQWPLLFKEKISIQPLPPFKNPGVNEVLKLTGPAILGGAAVQINVLINTQFAASLGDGAVSWLSYAFRFMQLPLGLFGVAIASAFAPAFSKLLAENKTHDLKKSLQASIRMCLFLCLPATVLLLFFAKPVVGVVYQQGRFQAFDTTQTSLILMGYAFAICGYSLIKIYQPAFLSFGNSVLPMRVSLISIFLNFLFNSFFVAYLKGGPHFLAISTSLVATFNFMLLAFFFKRHLPSVWDFNLMKSVFKILVASGISGVMAYAAVFYLGLTLSLNKAGFALELLVAGACFSTSYLVLALAFKIEEAVPFVAKFKKICHF